MGLILSSPFDFYMKKIILKFKKHKDNTNKEMRVGYESIFSKKEYLIFLAKGLSIFMLDLICLLRHDHSFTSNPRLERSMTSEDPLWLHILFLWNPPIRSEILYACLLILADCEQYKIININKNNQSNNNIL